MPAPPSSPSTDTGRMPLVALRYRDFRLLWLGQLISGAGTQMQFVAINYQIYQLTGSPVALGLVGLFRVVPIIVFSLIAGVVADIMDRRRLLLVTQTALMAVAVALAALTDAHLITVWAIYGLTSLGAVAVAFDNPARQSLLPHLVPRHHFTNAVSLNTIVWQGANIAGPALAGIVIGRLDVAAVYWLNAASFLAVIAALLLMKTSTRSQGQAPSVGVSALREGLSFVLHQPLIRATMFLDFIATFFAAANQLLPVFATDILHVGPEGLGLLYSGSAVGAVVTSAGLSFFPRLRRQGPTILASVALYGLATIAFGLSRSLWLSFLALALTGAADIVSTVIRQTVRQLMTPDRLRGRMVSVTMIFFMGGPQLGELEAGLLAGLVGAPLSVVVGGVACLAAVLVVALTSRALRAYDEPSAEDHAAVARLG